MNKSIARRAFISSLPVLMGYLAMGFAAGVLLTAKSGIRFPVFWAWLTSGVCISGALQFMFVDWIVGRMSMLDVALLTFCLNVRYAMYGLSLFDRFTGINFWHKCYLIWTLTDETYALEVADNAPKGKDYIPYCTLLAALDHFYWIAGVVAGAIAGTALPFSNKGIDFAMTALFLVILTDQMREKKNRRPAAVGLIASFAAWLVFGATNMLIPAIILTIVFFLMFRRKIEARRAEGNAVQ